MKITAKQFALSLYESVDGKSPSQVKSVIEKFVGLIAGRSQLKLTDKIIKELKKIWNEKNGLVEAEAVSARELGKDTAKLLKNYIAKLSGAKKVTLEEKIDKSLLGGVVIKYGDKVLDGSLRASLEELKNKMVK